MRAIDADTSRRHSLTCEGIDIDFHKYTAVCFLGARLPCPAFHGNALHCTWRVHARTWAFKHSLLDPRSRSVKVALFLILRLRQPCVCMNCLISSVASSSASHALPRRAWDPSGQRNTSSSPVVLQRARERQLGALYALSQGHA